MPKKIIEEKDLYACGIIVEATQIIFSKKRTSSNAVENKESAKIEKTKNKIKKTVLLAHLKTKKIFKIPK